ncbi:MAG: LysR family transcriptional regulator [Gammaproteobacteria bacterium]|nr:LysR family transcriptional regulator [Gammaproteobacteria bacterium]
MKRTSSVLAKQGRDLLQPGGEFRLGRQGEEFVSERRIALLEAIDATGSITQAAKQAGMSYKGAWESLEQMNNLAEHPIMERQAGGRHGGGTVLTGHGRHLVSVYRRASGYYHRFLDLLRDDMVDLETFFTLDRRLGMQISIRNQLLGKIAVINTGAVNTEVKLSLGERENITAIVTNEGVEQLNIGLGDDVIAMFKESSVFLAVGDHPPRMSARNCLEGEVSRIDIGSVNAEVVLALPGGKSMISIISNDGLASLGISVGDRIWACIKASDVMLATAG